MDRKQYPSDVTDEEWACVASYLSFVGEDAPQRPYPLREVFTALRLFVKAGAHWRMMPHDLPAWLAVYPQPRFRDLARDHKRLEETLVVHDLIAFAGLLLQKGSPKLSVI